MFYEINTSNKIFSNLTFFSRFAFIDLMKKVILSLGVISVLTSCSVKNNSFKNRTYHKMTSWYNALFNAEEELDKVKEDHLSAYQYNWSQILPVDPTTSINYVKKQPNTTNPNQQDKVETPTGLDAVETKALRAIEKHSMFIDGKEHNTMIGRAYLLMGKARYYKKEYFEALDALNFVKTQLPNSKFAEEAQVYLTLAELKGGNFYDGREKLAEMYEEGMSKKNLQLEVAKNFGQYLIDTQKYELATEVLTHAEDLSKNKEEKARLNFILGQLYAQLEDKQTESEAHFMRAYELKPGFDMEIKSQLAIADNFKKDKNDYDEYKNHFLNVSKKQVYKSRVNELEYAIAKIALENENLEEAELYLKKSLSEKVNFEPFTRSKAYETYADLEFKRGNYLYATAYYDSAVTLNVFENEQKRINVRSEALKKLMEKYYLVQKNDSILKLANMPKAEQESFFQKYIDELKAKEEQQRLLDEQMAENESTNFQLGNRTSSFTSSFDQGGRFYFYNPGLKGEGVNEFKRVWGNQTLRDNWRTSEGGMSALEQRELELTGKIEEGNPRRFELEFYIEKIPTQSKMLHDLKIERDTTELSLGTGYYDQFLNEKLALQTLEHLVSTPPKNIETKANAIYQMYRIAKAENHPNMETYKNQILNEFPNSIYAGYINNPMEDYLTPETKEALQDYEKAYNLYVDGKYDEVKTNVKRAIEQYPTQVLIAKFALLNAYAVGKSESVENFRNSLEVVTIAYDGTDEAKQAKRLLDRLDKKAQQNEDRNIAEDKINETTAQQNQMDQKNNRRGTEEKENTINQMDEEVIDPTVNPLREPSEIDASDSPEEFQ